MMVQPAKKIKIDGGSDLASKLKQSRESTAENVSTFAFNSKRVQLLAGKEEFLSNKAKGVAYYMHRDQRLQDNWAALYAQKLALENKLPLYVVAGISVKHPTDSEATRRTVDFSLGGLEEVAAECRELGIEFHFLEGHNEPMFKRILEFIKVSEVGCVVADFSPLKQHRSQIEALQKEFSKMNGPLLYQVDAHNVVPVWEASDKQEYAARTIRKKIMDRLKEFLTEFPPVISHPIKTKFPSKSIDWDHIKKSLVVDESVKSCEWASPGTLKGLEMLESFVSERLKFYENSRNDPNVKALSNLSPWFHFGQLGSQRAALYVKKYGKSYSGAVASYIEESLVRCELSDNYCYYQPNYDNLKGASDWAVKTLNDHRKDKREYVYTKEELDSAHTHDELWNAAQVQLKTEGKIHGFMRMYWAKKILEWTKSPEEALEFSLYFNDHYSLDGADSNGFVGCMWSVAGLHDQGWTERSVFGKIRYMNYAGCKRKFDIAKYSAKYGGGRSYKK